MRSPRCTAIIMSGLLLALLGALVIPCATNRIPAAFACGSCANSTSGTMTLAPAGGPVGTVVIAQITLVINTTVTFKFTFTTTDPASAGCVQGQTSASVPPFLITPSVQSDTTYAWFRWPAELSPGKYWLCAIPQTAGIPTVVSTQPFTEVAGTLPASAIQVDISSTLPGHGSYPGDLITVTITNWQTISQGNPNVYLLPRGATPDHMIDLSDKAQFVQGNGVPGQPTYQAYVPLPGTITPGAYAIIAQGDCTNGTCIEHAQSAFFTVVALPTSGPPQNANSGNVLANTLQQPLIAISLGVLAFIVALLLLMPLVRRRRRAQWNG